MQQLTKAAVESHFTLQSRVDNFVAFASLLWGEPVRAGDQHRAFVLAGMSHLTSVPTDWTSSGVRD